jgi:hypothetical protein
MAALDLAQGQGARSIDLTSQASRVAANRLYQQLGFRLRDSNVYRYQPQQPAPLAPSRPRRAAAALIRAGSVRHREPLVLDGHERSRSASQEHRSQAVHRYGLGRRSTRG